MYVASNAAALIFASYSALHATYPGDTRIFTNSVNDILLGTNNVDRLGITSTGGIVLIQAGSNFSQNVANSGAANSWTLINSSDTASSEAFMLIGVGGPNSHAAYTNYRIGGGEADWSVGVAAGTRGDLDISESVNLDDTYVRMKVWQGGRISFRDIHNNVDDVSSTTDQFLASGTYTPTEISNVNAPSVSYNGYTRWTRVGNVVHVSGSINTGTLTSAGGTLTSISFSLPLATAIANILELTGTMNIPNTANLPLGITGDVANDCAVIQFSCFNTGIGALFFEFSYTIQ
jgi:hypothetical protein